MPQVLDDDEVTDQFIRTVASEVRGHDEEYENTLQEREKSNPKYAFLFKDVSVCAWTITYISLLTPLFSTGDIDITVNSWSEGIHWNLSLMTTYVT